MSLSDAVAAPRVHHQGTPDEIQLETGTLSDDELAALRAMGHTVSTRDPMGYAPSIRVVEGQLDAHGDPRNQGAGRSF
jgi:gamma-glutamyltranspeptidase/glutathione hydrolase